jgi:hypothetical protein
LVLYKELIRLTASDIKTKETDIAAINAQLGELNRMMAALEAQK